MPEAKYMISDSKFKKGEVVYIRSWHDFDSHLSIPSYYWQGCMNKPLTISNIEYAGDSLYYNFKNKSFGWKEDFIKHNHKPMLPDNLFEI